ncbi:DUF6151 family protein [Salinivibrio sp. ML323]|uniref:DUF6151 family protein n=1 Tax=Salinivibrio sp. ML323 TaxID=1909474 RepID=UPI001055F8AC|nr:DUF6151 family protein [Salinivibrio sp. ML323]
MARLAIRCSCGQMTGEIIDAQQSQRCVCFCSDCQAYAQTLGYHTELEPGGGTEVLQITPSQLRIYRGRDQLTCLRLSERGLYRWYTHCCQTPIANTIHADIPFVGVVSACYQIEGDNEEEIGPVRWYVQGQDARSTPTANKVHARFPLRLMIITAVKGLWTRLLGKHRPNVFFDREGRPRGLIHHVEQSAPLIEKEKASAVTR